MIGKQPFGATGQMSTRTIFGGFAFFQATQEDADRTLDLLLEYGVNHIDTAISYGNSEDLIGPWMDRHRQDFFLATKTDERSYKGAWQQMRRSLERLHVDHVDLIQLHNLVDRAEWDTAMAPGGALEAVIEAREQGLTRFIGVTGHGFSAPTMHRRSLERFDFDSVLFPYNYLLYRQPAYAASVDALLAACRERNVAVQTIKAMGARWWDVQPADCNTGYRPISEPADVARAANWVLAEPGVFLNTTGDLRVLPSLFDAVTRLTGRPSDDEMDEMVARLDMAPLWDPSMPL